MTKRVVSLVLAWLVLSLLTVACSGSAPGAPTDESQENVQPPNERMRLLDFAPFESALAEMDDARMQSLDTLLMPATILDMQAM